MQATNVTAAMRNAHLDTFPHTFHSTGQPDVCLAQTSYIIHDKAAC